MTVTTIRYTEGRAKKYEQNEINMKKDRTIKSSQSSMSENVHNWSLWIADVQFCTQSR